MLDEYIRTLENASFFVRIKRNGKLFPERKANADL